MRAALLVTVLSLAVVSPAIAQETPIVDVSGGYSHLRFFGEASNGWYVTVGGNFTNWFGLVGDVSWHYRSEEFPPFGDLPGGRAEDDVRAILGGPRFTFRSGRVAAFGHVKGGVVTSHWSFYGSSGENSNAAVEMGGGVDVWVLPRLAVRGGADGRLIFDEDWDDRYEGGFRLHVGIVVGLGRR